MLSPKRDLIAAKLFLRLALSGGGPRPRVINVDGHPAYARAIAELKQTGELGRHCRCRTAPYLNNVIEQDHRFIKKRIIASLGFRSTEGACRTIDEAMHAIRKGQVRWVAKGDALISPPAHPVPPCGRELQPRRGQWAGLRGGRPSYQDRAAMTGFLHVAREVVGLSEFGVLDWCVATAELNELMRI